MRFIIYILTKTKRSRQQTKKKTDKNNDNDNNNRDNDDENVERFHKLYIVMFFETQSIMNVMLV